MVLHRQAALRAGARAFAQRTRSRSSWRAFELDPTAPPCARRHPRRVARQEVRRRGRRRRGDDRPAIDRDRRQRGLEYRFDRARRGNTFDAHRLLHLAHERGEQDAMKERLLRALLHRGRGDRRRRDARDARRRRRPRPAEVARRCSRRRRTRDEVRATRARARVGIRGVPFFVIGGKLGVSGAQAPEVLLGALERGWAKKPPRRSSTVPRAAPTAASHAR